MSRMQSPAVPDLPPYFSGHHTHRSNEPYHNESYHESYHEPYHESWAADSGPGTGQGSRNGSRNGSEPGRDEPSLAHGYYVAVAPRAPTEHACAS